MDYKQSNQKYQKRKYGVKRKYASTAEQKATKALAEVRKIKKQMNVEYKFLDNLVQNTPSWDIPTEFLFSGLNQGDGASDRGGDSVKFVRLNIRATFEGTSSSVSTILRTALVVDRQANNAAVTMEDYINRNSDANDVIQMRNLAYNKRFLVLDDSTHVLSLDKPKIEWRFNKNFEIRPRYSGTGNSITDINTNSFYYLMWSDQESIANPPVCSTLLRLRYVDN